MQKIADTYPLVSFILLTYNQEKYIRAALEGLLAQDYSNLEYIISDDCSRDMTCSIIQETVDQKFAERKVVFNRNENNLGLTGNLNKAISLANGEYYILAAGDDISLSNRVSTSIKKIAELGVDSLALNFQYINAEGQKLNQKGFDGEEAELKISLGDYLCRKPLFPSGPSRIISKRVFDIFGMLREDCPTEDTTLTFRSLLLNGVAMVNQIGVLYRWHGQNMSTHEALMERINPVDIYRQYNADLMAAYKKNIVTPFNYLKIKRILWDYKHVQAFERRLYKTHGMIKKHFIGVGLLLNPFVLCSHKSRKWLMRICPELFMVRNKIQYMLNR